MAEFEHRHFAQFTTVFVDVLEENPDILDGLTMDTEAHTNAFKDMLIGTYYDYEIAGETIGEFEEMLNMRFKQIKPYYVELLDGYETKIDMLGGRKTTRTVSETKDMKRSGNDTKNGTNSASTENSESLDSTKKLTDLPRSDASQNRPTSITEDSTDTSGNTSANGSYEDKGTFSNNGTDTLTRTAEVTGVDTQADLKRKYLELIRNVYHEMAMEMKPCFLTLFF